MKKIVTAICICSFVCSGLAAESQSGSKDKTHAKIFSKADFGRLREGVGCFTDFEKRIQFTKLHKPYLGKPVSLYESFDSYEPLTFKVKKEGIVTILVSNKFPGCSFEELQSDGWVVVDKIGLINMGSQKKHELSILEKELPEGKYTFEKGKGIGIRLIKM